MATVSVSPTKIPTDHLIRLAPACRILRMSESALRRAFDSGRVPGIRLGGSRWFDKSVIERLATERTAKATGGRR